MVQPSGFSSFNSPTSFGGPGFSSFDPDDDFSVFREQNPEFPFFGALDRANPTPNQRDVFKTRASQICNRFQGRLDARLAAGEVPTETFSDFIGSFNFQREFQNSSSFSGRAAPIQRVIRR